MVARGRCQIIEILNATEPPPAREAGALVAGILQTLKSRCEVGTNLQDINRWAQAMITEAGALSCYVDYEPSFGRGPFGHYICTSVNEAVLHGLPSDDTLANGDLLTLDLAVANGGVVADSAISFIVGDSKSWESVAMINATERALRAGIAAARPGARIGDISHAIGAASARRGIGSTPSSAVMASARQCTKNRPSHYRATRSWRQTAPWLLLALEPLVMADTAELVTDAEAGHSKARRAAGLHTVSTRSRSPTTEPKSSPCRSRRRGIVKTCGLACHAAWRDLLTRGRGAFDQTVGSGTNSRTS